MRVLRHLLLGGLLLPLLLASPAQADIIGKRPQILDVGKLFLNGRMIRLFGIAPPSSDALCRIGAQDWNCGMAARWAMADRISLNWVACREQGVDSDGAVVAICYLGGIGGPELNLWMVEQGWARAWRPETRAYDAAEAAARQAGRGLWQSNLQ